MGKYATFAQAKTDALKILGKDGDIPAIPNTLDKAAHDATILGSVVQFNVSDFKRKLNDLREYSDTCKAILTRYLSSVSGSPLGLDGAKDKDKITKASAILKGYINDQLQACSAFNKQLDELGKLSAAMNKYSDALELGS